MHAPSDLHSREERQGSPIWRPVLESGGITARRGALAASIEPIGILRHGVSIEVSPTEAALLSLLVRKGRATHMEIAAALSDLGHGVTSLATHVHRIRRKFAAAGAPNPIETVRHWGLRLRIEPDASGSTSLWICGQSTPGPT